MIGNASCVVASVRELIKALRRPSRTSAQSTPQEAGHDAGGSRSAPAAFVSAAHLL